MAVTMARDSALNSIEYYGIEVVKEVDKSRMSA